MKIYLVAASLATALLLQAQVMAQAPHLSVEVIAPSDAKHAELLDLSTSLDTADLVRHVALPEVLASVQQRSDVPPKYDYSPARKAEWAYNRHRRYYNRLNRRKTRDIRQANLQKARVDELDQRRQDRRKPRAQLPNPKVLLDLERKRRI